MILRLAVVVVCLLACAVFGGDIAVPEGDDAKTLDAKVTEVTVYADRARVLRATQTDLAAGTLRLAIRDLPGWIDEGSVRVAVLPAAAAQIMDVEVRRTFLAKPKDEELRKAEAAVREIADEIAGLGDERAVLDTQAKQVEAIRAFSLDKLPKDMAVREIKLAEYGQVVEFVGDALRKIAKARRELDVKLRERQPELSARQKKLDELCQRGQLEKRTIIVSLKAAAAAKAELQFSYMLPGAAWEPVHELRATPGGKTVSLASFAVVRQTTGEDWAEANIILSTQNTTATMQVPELKALLVGSGRAVAVAMQDKQQQETFEQAKGNFRSQFELYNRANNPQAMQKAIFDNEEATQRIGAQMRVVFQRLSQRGTTAHFAALSRQIIRTDGTPVRVPIGTVELAGDQRVIAAPAISLNAARTIELLNSGTQPLLPGKVSLFLEGAFLGTTETGFVAEGETFSMFLGVVDRVKLSRHLDSKHSSHTSEGKRTRVQASWSVCIENLSDSAIALQLSDRVPVSQTEEIRVRNIRVAPECRPDEKGLVRWEVTLGPRQAHEFRIEYTLEYPSDLPARLMQQQAANPANYDEGESYGQELHRQVQELEQQLNKK